MSTPHIGAPPNGPTPLSGSAVRLFELITSSWVAAAVSAAAELGVADAEALHRLLRACADLGIVRELPGRDFALTELGAALREDSPDSMRGYARWMGNPAERSTMFAELFERSGFRLDRVVPGLGVSVVEGVPV